MALAKVALDGKFVRPAAQHPESFAVTTSAPGPLYWLEKRLAA